MTRYGVLFAIVAALLAPAEAEAGPFLDWLHGKNRKQTAYYPAVPNYTASYAAPQCGTCTTTCTQRVCNYVPQTAYRTSYVNVPVTTYRPVTTQNACSGCTTTCMRPITTYVQRPTLVPYTAYRQVCRTVTSQPQTTYFAQPAAAAQPIPTAAPCSSCAATPASYTQPIASAPLGSMPAATAIADPAAATTPSIAPGTYIPPATPRVTSDRAATAGGYPSAPATAAPSQPATQQPAEAETQGSSLHFDAGPDLSNPLDKTAYRASGGWRVYNTATERVARNPQPAATSTPVQRGGWRVAD